jgi:hypothetical protein
MGYKIGTLLYHPTAGFGVIVALLLNESHYPYLTWWMGRNGDSFFVDCGAESLANWVEISI